MSGTPDELFHTIQGTMVMVNKGGGGGSNSQSVADPELARLERIPSFLPIMRATLSGAAGAANKADPDILERLDYRGLLSLCQRTENHLRLSAAKVSTEQECCRIHSIYSSLVSKSQIQVENGSLTPNLNTLK